MRIQFKLLDAQRLSSATVSHTPTSKVPVCQGLFYVILKKLS